MDKKNKNPNVPNLRFEKFNNNWSRTTISKVCVCNPKNEDKLDDEFIYIDLESVEKGVLKSKNIIHLKNAPSRAQRILYKNDILFQSVRPYQRNNYLLNKDDDFLQYVASTGYIQLRTTLNPYFLFQLLNTDKINNEVMLRCTGTSYPAINSNDFSNILITITNDRNEQNKIAKFFSLIEERIQTQIKIIDDCISYRNAIVDYYFESLSGNWKKVKLSNILKEYSELHIKDDSIVHATLSKEGIFPKTDRYDRDFLVKDEDKKYKVTHLNDICYNPANLKFGVITRNTFGDCIISPIYITFKIKSGFIPKFVELLVTRKQFISKARKYEQGTVYERMSVNSSDLLSMYVLIPSFSIQQKIVNIINNIDNKIFNEQKLLNLYKLQKVYLLKNMFI